MKNTSPIYESLWVQLVKMLLMATCAVIYTWPLVNTSGHIAAAVAACLACLVAAACAKVRLRILWCAALSLAVMGIGIAGSALTLERYGLGSIAATITGSRLIYFFALIFGISLILRSLSMRWRAMQLLEVALFTGAPVFMFFAHRDFNLTNPRQFVDTLYSNGYNPIDAYRWIGAITAFTSLLLLLRRATISKTLYSLAFLATICIFAAGNIGTARLTPNVQDPLGLKSQDNGDDGDDDDNDGENSEDNDDKDNASGKNDQNSKNKKNHGPTNHDKPTPVAVAVFYDEYTPASGVLYFRQGVLSEYDGNHLVASDIDSDVISAMPASGSASAQSLQSETIHQKISTSMFLMQEHAKPPQLAMGTRIFVIQNPDPGVFVAAYGVESLGLTLDIQRLIGRKSIPDSWSEEKRAHYLKIPDDPRYQALSDIIVRRIDPRFTGDDIAKALYIKTWLEKEGFYTLKTRHIDIKDPTASFLFGSLRGYCVHFAHAAALLLRSQGIAARVAIGYAVSNRLRGTNSAVLILGNQAHAWPEIYVDGVGWVTFDIYPENGDAPPGSFVDQDLESLFGELARDDKSGGKAPAPLTQNRAVPWRKIQCALIALLIALLFACYLRKLAVILIGTHSAQIHKKARAVAFVWTMYGHPWQKYLTLENFARSKAGTDSATGKIFQMAARTRFSNPKSSQPTANNQLLRDAFKEAARKTPLWRKILGWLNPIVRG